MFALYIIYHKILYNHLYETITKDNQKYIHYYGVKDKIENTPFQIQPIYEYELPIYNKDLQEKNYNECSAFYHIYQNNLHTQYQYIGFLQYDMVLPNTTINTIKNTIENNPNTPIIFASYFATEKSINNLEGSIQLSIKPISFFGTIIDNYNAFFGKNYTFEQIITQPFIMCNLFVIPTHMYEKYMKWLCSTYFLCNIYTINEEELYNICSVKINPGHVIEVCSAIFLAIELLEGNHFCQINIIHDHNLRI